MSPTETPLIRDYSFHSLTPTKFNSFISHTFVPGSFACESACTSQHCSPWPQCSLFWPGITPQNQPIKPNRLATGCSSMRVTPCRVSLILQSLSLRSVAILCRTCSNGPGKDHSTGSLECEPIGMRIPASVDSYPFGPLALIK